MTQWENDEDRSSLVKAYNEKCDNIYRKYHDKIYDLQREIFECTKQRRIELDQAYEEWQEAENG